MTQGVQLVLWIAGVHVVGFACIAVLMLPSLRDGRDPPAPGGRLPDEGDDGWGRGPKLPPSRPDPPRGGIPLPDAVPALVRLRDHRRLGERLSPRERRPAREPARAPRVPHR